MANPTSPPVETVSTGADKAKLAVAGVLVVAAVVVFYALGKQDLWLRVAALLVLMVLAAVTFFTSEPGKQLIAPIAMEGGLRFAIREGGRTVGAGVVAKILE